MRQMRFAVKKIGWDFSTSVWIISGASREMCENDSNHEGLMRIGARWKKAGVCTNLGR
jgi:hypothetical protein